MENNDRFLRIALYQGDRSSKKVRKIPAAAANVNESKEPLTDPTLLCCAFKKHRIYLFRYESLHLPLPEFSYFLKACTSMSNWLLVCTDDHQITYHEPNCNEV